MLHINQKAGSGVVQIGQVNGNVYLVKKESRPLAKDVSEALNLHKSLSKDAIISINNWMRKEFATAMITELNKADLGRALRYIRSVHQRLNSTK